jgi:lysophospholipase L1-like esterase
MSKTTAVSTILLTTCFFLRCNAQDTIAYTLEDRFRLVKEEENILHNATSLNTFFEKLYQLRSKKNGRVNMVQIGDSHIQADFFSGAVRQHLNLNFGNGGRGLIFPWKLARTNEAFGVTTYSPSVWDVNKIINPDLTTPIGICGAALKTLDKDAVFTIKTTNFPSLNYRFDRLTVFYLKNPKSYHFIVKDSLNEDVAFIGPYTFEQANTSKVQLPFATNQVSIKALQSVNTQNQAVLFGVNLENDKPGVIFHSIGVNSAKYRHYLSARYFAEQTAALTPDLFILSLGTNEALEYPYSDPHLANHIDSLINQLKRANPQAQFIITTPSDSYKKKTKRNPGVELVRTTIIDYANKHNLAYFDLYEASGGKHSADRWKKVNYLRADGIHFSVDGYRLQGNMLYGAIIKAFNEYVLYRHP